MELVFTLLGIGIGCGIAGFIGAVINEKGDSPIAGLFQVAGLGGALIILCGLLPLAILVKTVQYFWNF